MSPNTSFADKAAQAAAQAAQAAAFQAQYHPVQVPSQNPPSLTPEQAMQLLEKFGITQLVNNQAPPNTNADAGQANTSEQAMNQFDTFTLSSFEQRLGMGGSAFSPFSPDPNYLAEGMNHRENSISVSPSHAQSFSSVSSKGYPPWYSQDEKAPAMSTSGKASPTGPVAQSSRPSSARPFSHFLGEAGPNRTSSRQEGPIARPDIPRMPSQGMEHFAAGSGREHDPIHDLDGTLASLSLNSQASWKLGLENTHTSSS
jgi:hypothetical protein